jgi:hypothetical protein
MQQQEGSAKKKKYEKPEAKRFPLRPEEAVLGFCKTNAASGPSSVGCRGLSSCAIPGS